MSKIKIEDIREELKKDNWKLISDTYANLEAELVFECSEGHRVYSSWKKIRTQRTCPICQNNPLKNIDTKIIPKKNGITRILALDQATRITGWSIYDEKELIKYGLFETSLDDEIARDHAIKEWVINMINTSIIISNSFNSRPKINRCISFRNISNYKNTNNC